MAILTEPGAAPTPPRLPWRTKLGWALGSLGDNYAGNAINQLKDPVYTFGLGVPPELTGLALSVPRLLDAFFDPVVGLWSDNWQGKHGRRRPFILVGALALGLTMASIWLPPTGAGWSHSMLAGYFMVTSMLFYAAYSVFLVPYRALGVELTSDYHERTRLQAWGMVIGLVGGFGIPWLYKLCLLVGHGDHPPTAQILVGAQWVGAGVGGLILVTCLVPALACREPTLGGPVPKLQLFSAIAVTLRNRSFLQMLGMNFFAIIGMYTPVTISLLVSVYYLNQGNQDTAANLQGSLGMTYMVGSLVGVPINTRLSQWMGKRGTALASLGVASAGFVSLIWTLLPTHPYWALFSNFLMGWGMQGIWLMSATMNADVCDQDELATGGRRAGMYGAVFALEQKIAFAVAALLSGYLVSRSGYVAGTTPDLSTALNLRYMQIAIPLVGMGLAALTIFSYPLSHARVVAIQMELSSQRGRAQR